MRALLSLAAAALLLTGCASEKGIVDKDGYQLDTRHQAQAAYPRIKVLVIHYTADDFDTSLATLTDKNVSSHYLIPSAPPRYRGSRVSGNWCRNRSWPGMQASVSGAARRASTTPQSVSSWKTAAGGCRRARNTLRHLSRRRYRR